MNEDDTETAIQNAYEAFQSWKKTTAKVNRNFKDNWENTYSLKYYKNIAFAFQHRSQLLKKWYELIVENQEELARILTMENVSFMRKFLSFHIRGWSQELNEK